MKKLLLPLVLALCCLPLHSQLKARAVTPQATTPTSIAFNWQYTANAPTCGSTLANCYSGFTLTRTDVTPNVTIATPSTLGPTALSYTWTPATLPVGTLTFSLVANGYNTSGGALTSAPATASVTNGLTTLNPPTGLTGVAQ
jgi:hypothetical protein